MFIIKEDKILYKHKDIYYPRLYIDEYDLIILGSGYKLSKIIYKIFGFHIAIIKLHNDKYLNSESKIDINKFYIIDLSSYENWVELIDIDINIIKDIYINRIRNIFIYTNTYIYDLENKKILYKYDYYIDSNDKIIYYNKNSKNKCAILGSVNDDYEYYDKCKNLITFIYIYNNVNKIGLNMFIIDNNVYGIHYNKILEINTDDNYIAFYNKHFIKQNYIIKEPNYINYNYYKNKDKYNLNHIHDNIYLDNISGNYYKINNSTILSCYLDNYKLTIPSDYKICTNYNKIKINIKSARSTYI